MAPDLKAACFSLNLPVALPNGTDWQPFYFFAGNTPSLANLSCHVSMLRQGSCPHPPHRHDEEEILLLLRGKIEIDVPEAEQARTGELEPEDFIYYPSRFPHTLKALSKDGACYLMFRWKGPEKGATAERLSFRNGNARAFDNLTVQSAGFSSRNLFAGKTAFVKKLHGHVSLLMPGVGYAPHQDAYDVAIVLMEGSLETLGQRIDAPAVIFYPAGESHGLSNPSEKNARYLVFEFHGFQTKFGTRLKYQSKELWERISDPVRWKRKIKKILNRAIQGY